MRRIFYLAPVLVFAALAAFLWRSLSKPHDELPSALIDKPAPTITVPPLDPGQKGFGPADLGAGHVTVVNIWASWCAPCRTESEELSAIAKLKGVLLVGLAWKDTRAKARAFLDEVGNPFSRVVLDEEGRAGIEWGISGVPETFIVDGRGIVRERFVGPITEETLEKDVKPAIERARNS